MPFTIKRLALSCLLFAVIAPTIALSQAQRPGYIVNHEGDTLRGFVEEQFSSGYNCRFSREQNGAAAVYNAKDIVGYGFDSGLRFRSAKLKNILKFFEVVITGKASLLAIDNDFGVLKDSALIHLEQKSKSVNVNGIDYVLEDRTAIANLAGLLSDCKTGLAFDKVTIFGTSSSALQKKLTALVEEYNACVGSTSLKTKAQPQMSKGRINFSMFAGMAKPGIRTAGSIDYVFGADYKTDPVISFGALLHYTYPRVSNRAGIAIGFQYYRVSFSGDYASPPAVYTVSGDYSEVRALIGLRYLFMNKAWSPYLRAGCGLSYLSRSSVEITKTIGANKRDLYSIDLQSGGVSLHAGLGVVKKLKNRKSVFGELMVDTGANILLRFPTTSLYLYYPGINLGYTL
jgi:hypothetical protein